MGSPTAKSEKTRCLLLDLTKCMIRGDANRKIDSSSITRAKESFTRLTPNKRTFQQTFLSCQREYRVCDTSTFDPSCSHLRNDIPEPARVNSATWSENHYFFTFHFFSVPNIWRLYLPRRVDGEEKNSDSFFDLFDESWFHKYLSVASSIVKFWRPHCTKRWAADRPAIPAPIITTAGSTLHGSIMQGSSWQVSNLATLVELHDDEESPALHALFASLSHPEHFSVENNLEKLESLVSLLPTKCQENYRLLQIFFYFFSIFSWNDTKRCIFCGSLYFCCISALIYSGFLEFTDVRQKFMVIHKGTIFKNHVLRKEK